MWEDINNLIKEVSLSFAATLIVAGSFWILINLLRVMFYEIQIEKKEKQRQKEILEIHKRVGQTIVFAERQEEAVNKRYDPEINNIKRKRSFILDRTPFIKK